MPRAIAKRSFDHNGKVTKGDEVTFDRVTMEALRRSGLVGPDLDGEAPEKTVAPKAPVPTVGSLGKAPQRKAKNKTHGAKSSASPVAPVLQPPTLPQSTPGALPPPLPVE